MSDRLAAVRHRIRRLKTLPVLPTLLTAGNLACGISAILCAAHYDRVAFPFMLELGAILIFCAMFFDMLDGKVARLTNTQGPFGAELDSLSDVVSFGVAPAILVHRLVMGQPGLFDHGQRLLWFITVFYAVMAAIRLARYNVEHSDAPTNCFRGIPSPGAAAVVCAWILFHQEYATWLSGLGLVEIGTYTGLESLDAYRWSLLGVTSVAALLMVSTVPYPHIGNTLFGRIGFRSMIVGLAVVSLLVWWPWITLFIATTGYMAYGLLAEGVVAWRRWRKGGSPLVDDDEEAAEDAGLVGGEAAHGHEDVGPAHGR